MIDTLLGGRGLLLLAFRLILTSRWSRLVEETLVFAAVGISTRRGDLEVGSGCAIRLEEAFCLSVQITKD